MTARRSPSEGRDRNPDTSTDEPGGRIRADARPLPPGPDGYPIVGNTLEFAREPFEFFDELATYGDVVRYRVAGRTFTTLLAPEHVERVLVEEPDRFERFLFSDRGFDFAPEGLLFNDGEQWRKQRQHVQPAFTLDRIRTYAETMVAETERTAETWDDGETVVLNHAFSNLTLRILSRALFDVDVDPTGDDEPITRAARIINERGDSGRLTTFLPTWLPTPANRRYRQAIAAYRDRVDELIDRRRADPDPGDDLLSILLRAGDGEASLSETEIRDNLITFTFAGHETTSLGLTYTFLLLATHDDVAATLREELETVLDGDRPGVEHAPHLEYTENVIQEAMRLYPPAYVLFRRATEDAALGGYRIPEGTILSIPQFRIHTDERFYDAPDEFRPERWDEDRDRPEYAYFPFGGGPRHCIGMRFATLEMKLVVATLAQRLELDLLSDPDPDHSPGATLQPADDVRVRVRRRT